MAFDKKNAMRNAERHLAQGKTKAAIGEYKDVVRHDPRDFVTLNILGDLHIKEGDESSAVKCFNAVAEHYSKQGFAAKAIAIYKKIDRIRPSIPEIVEKLGELYKERGSHTEARQQYEKLAQIYQSSGRKIDALAIWKEVALLDPNNIEVYRTIGDAYLEEKKPDEAIEAFVALGDRLRKLGRPSAAVDAYHRALDVDRFTMDALRGFVDTKFETGHAEDAIAALTERREEQPLNHDIARLRTELHIKCGNGPEAEEDLVKLVESEPSNYDLFLGLARIYLDGSNVNAAARVLTMSSEHLLAAGRIDEYRQYVNELLALDPDHVESLRLLVGLCTWLRDEPAYIDALKRLAASSRNAEDIEDERLALSQLTMVVPHEQEYVERLRELNELLGIADEGAGENLFDKQFLKRGSNAFADAPSDFAFAEAAVVETHNGSNGVPVHAVAEPEAMEFGEVEFADPTAVPLQEDDEDRLRREIDSIRFYVDNGYIDLAEKATGELEQDFGDRPEIEELKSFIAANGGQASAADQPASAAEQDAHVEAVAEPKAAALPEVPDTGMVSGTFDFNDLRSELGLEEEVADEASSDYETNYNTAIAYQEMGLTEEAIKEFQNAAALASPKDGTRRFYQCANMLGHCFMEIGKPHLAITWYLRILDVEGLTVDEKQGLWYEYANACEANGDPAKAAEYFERVYAENIDFRDVAQRLEKLAVAA